ncbi:hypothetical protein DESC_40134 [Desulfosarcina cetonica]|nr:hypothetical protein DESC_40134 [Desulfosarcina cetonica]
MIIQKHSFLLSYQAYKQLSAAEGNETDSTTATIAISEIRFLPLLASRGTGKIKGTEYLVFGRGLCESEGVEAMITL